ncbi:MAG TPA: lipase maturation factor family protein [Thermoanaerobaculia bacterium]|nr:lipase maturation factor family protein [Thermoanaerobaculia bacterium]
MRRRSSSLPGSASVEERHHLLRELLLRLLGGVFLIAFVSIWVQVDGLIGSRGILPIGSFSERAAEALGASRWWQLPSLLWLAPEDWMLDALCAAGVGFSILAMLGVGTVPVFVTLWAIYLSLVVGGQVFFQFQWDGLLLETALCSLFLAPWTFRPGRLPMRPDPEVGVWLWRLLVVKLMVLSGAVKLISFDETWWTLSALDAHFETQPLPLWTSWYAHHLSPSLLRAGVALTLVIEILVPFLVFWSRGARRLAAALLIGLQALIAGTGNYGFFNLLSIVLCLSLLDDSAISWLVPRSWRRRLARRGEDDAPLSRWLPAWRRGRRERRAALLARGRWVLAALLGCAMVLVTVRELAWSVPRDRETPSALRPLAAMAEWVQPALSVIDPFRSINGYGLFRAMTLERPELIVEASENGVDWLEVRFRHKPGDVTRRPRLVAPHMPRLDWQMWFAALDPRGASGWLQPFLLRLGAAEPAVLDLLEATPYGERRPAFLRLVLYDYRFTTPAERLASGAWWRRERLGELSAPLATSSLNE